MYNALLFMDSISTIVKRARDERDERTEAVLAAIELQNNRAKEAVLHANLVQNNRDIALCLAIIEARSIESMQSITAG